MKKKERKSIFNWNAIPKKKFYTIFLVERECEEEKCTTFASKKRKRK